MRRGRIIFKGNFLDYCIKFVLITILGFATFGIGLIYLPYWSVKYFVANLEIEFYE